MELLIVLALISIVALLCFSTSVLLVNKNEQQILLDELKNCIQHAKIHAIQSGHSLYLGPIDPSLNWAKGIKLMQFNKDHQLKPLRQWIGSHSNWNLTWSGTDSSKLLQISNNPTNAISNGTFVLLNTRTQEQFYIRVNRLGRMRKVSL